MKRNLFLIVLAAYALCGCVSLVYYDGTYHGRVIDAQTREPIEGAVVLGVWSKGYMGAGGIAHEYYDARETVTDAQGEFTIEGMGPRMVTHLQKMDVVIFKAGYEHVGRVSWDALKMRDHIKWENSKAIIPLEQWSKEQRRRRFDASVTSVPNEKQKLLLEEIEKDKKLNR
jgi:hypothetical protein